MSRPRCRRRRHWRRRRSRPGSRCAPCRERACAPWRAPIIAAAMLSRNAESTKTMHQQREAAFPVVRQDARQRERQVALLEVLGQEREAEEQAARLARITHSWPRWASSPPSPGPSRIRRRRPCRARSRQGPRARLASVRWWKRATPARVRPNSRNSKGIPSTERLYAWRSAPTREGRASRRRGSTHAVERQDADRCPPGFSCHTCRVSPSTE